MSTKAMIDWELKNTPLGLGNGDPQLGAPFSRGLPIPRVFLRNWSATRKRKYIKIPVSFYRGAEDALASEKNLRDIFNLATFQALVGDGIKPSARDMNVYSTKIEKVLYAPLFDGKRYFVPPAKGSEDPPAVQVPDGLWDILCGNYERMHSPNPKTKNEEEARFAASMIRKLNPIAFITVDGERVEKTENPFGFIEIERRTEKLEPVTPDTEFLTAMEMVG